MKRLHNITNSMDMSRELVEDRETWCTVVHGSQRAGHDLVTKLQQQENYIEDKMIPKQSRKGKQKIFNRKLNPCYFHSKCVCFFCIRSEEYSSRLKTYEWGVCVCVCLA